MKAKTYRLVLGVSGERNLQQPERVVTSVERLLRQLQQALQITGDKSTLQLKYSILSPLAKGADRIVASAAMQLLDAELKVVTPLPLDAYRQDFVEQEDRQEFESLLKRDPDYLELRKGDHLDWHDAELRNQAYLAAGHYIVDACEILIVVWDGKPAVGVGGTGDVVSYALKRGRKILWIDSNHPDRLPQMLVPEESSDATKIGYRVIPFPTHRKQVSKALHRFHSFHRDCIVTDGEIEQSCKRFCGDLERDGASAGLSAGWSASSAELATIMTKADLMAIAYQARYNFAAQALFRLSAIAVTVAIFQILFLPSQLWLIAFEILAMLAAAGLLYRSKSEAWHEKWLNDRYLAEWLRANFYLAILQDDRDEVTKSEMRMPFYSGPDHWFIEALRESVTRFRRSIPELEFESRKQFLSEHWIRSQANWHGKNAKRKHKKAHRYHRFGISCFCLTILMATLHMFGFGHSNHGDNANHDEHSSLTPAEKADTKDSMSDSQSNQAEQAEAEIHSLKGPTSRFGDLSLWISFFAVILPAWGAATHAIASLLDYERIAKRSERMSVVLNEIADHVSKAGDIETLAHYVRQAEEIMASENHEWLASLSFRKLVLPA
jgi:hypothetical protein